MDYLLIAKQGEADLVLEKYEGLLNNIYLSLAIKKGSWWADPEFGLRDRGRMKLTEQTERLVRDDCLEALQWLIDVGRARTIEVMTEREAGHTGRLKVLVRALKADGQFEDFQTFIEVV